MNELAFVSKIFFGFLFIKKKNSVALFDFASKISKHHSISKKKKWEMKMHQHKF